MSTRNRIVLTALTVATIFSGTAVYALPADAALIPKCNPVPHSPRQENDCSAKDLILLLQNIYNFLLGMSAIIAIIFIIFGGARMFIWSALENPQEELAAAKRTVLRAITGLVIILAAYIIVNTLIVALSGGGLTIDAVLKKGLNP